MRLNPSNVGVAPGTTTLQLNGVTYRYADPYARGIVDMRGLGAIDTRARVRWDIIGVIGGLSLLIALSAALAATAIGGK
jgi:hypothetical protein